VLNIDVIWSSLLEPDLLDLRPFLASEIPQLEPQLLSSYTVNGKLVAVPFNVPLGALEYRPDLLREYGYDHPPRTWTELETMAERIQTGERAKGKQDFWGYVWQGAAGEALTCNALEWQASEGGGQIVEPDRTISVNNSAAIQSWQRAKRWIGWISPPGVVAYREHDSTLVFDSGRAAFGRIWLLTSMTRSGQARQIGSRDIAPPVVPTGFARMPAGAGGSVGTLGGTGTAVSMHSAHRREAIALLRYQLHFLMKSSENDPGHDGSATIEFTGAPSIADPAGSNQQGGIVARPSIVTGGKYKQVSAAYIDAVYSVLTGKSAARDAAAELEKQLVKITGFRTGPPGR
jgi:trehalose/maltose transport system substrate-binding protein